MDYLIPETDSNEEEQLEKFKAIRGDIFDLGWPLGTHIGLFALLPGPEIA